MDTLCHRTVAHSLLCREFSKVARLLMQCRGKTRFEQFKMGLGRNNMIKEIQKCDRHMNRMYDRFTVRTLF